MMLKLKKYFIKKSVRDLSKKKPIKKKCQRFMHLHGNCGLNKGDVSGQLPSTYEKEKIETVINSCFVTKLSYLSKTNLD